MTTWEEIRDEVAGMLADGKPLEEVISKLEEMKNPKPLTNEEWIKSMNTEQLAELLFDVWADGFNFNGKTIKYRDFNVWLKQPHR